MKKQHQIDDRVYSLYRFGIFTQCGASLNGEVCKSCSQCGGYDYTTISVDCTNLEDNAKMVRLDRADGIMDTTTHVIFLT